MGSVSKLCILFQSWFLKTSSFLPDQKSRALPCAYLLLYLFIRAVELSGWIEDSLKARWMLILATNQSSWMGQFFANQPKAVPPNFSRLILRIKRQFLFLTISVNSSGSSNRQVPGAKTVLSLSAPAVRSGNPLRTGLLVSVLKNSLLLS